MKTAFERRSATKGRRWILRRRLESSASGQLRRFSVVNGQEFDLSGRVDRPESMANTGSQLELGESKAQLLSRWGLLGPSFDSRAHGTRQSWGCDSCMVFGVGPSVGVGCCAATVVPCRVGVFTSGAQFVENWVDAYSHFHPIVVVEETAWV